jgi:hypothetical protein
MKRRGEKAGSYLREFLRPILSRFSPASLKAATRKKKGECKRFFSTYKSLRLCGLLEKKRENFLLLDFNAFFSTDFLLAL